MKNQYDKFGVNTSNSFNTPPANWVKVRRKRKFDPVKASAHELLDLLDAAVARVQLANEEGNPILSAWLPDARETLRKAKGG